MGFINDIINDLDKSQENYEEMRENLDLLVSLAEAKSYKFEKDLESDLKIGKVESDSSLFIPVTHISKKMTQYRCMTSMKPNMLIDKVTTSVTDIFNKGTAESVISGAAAAVSSVIEGFSGVAAGSEQRVSVCTLALDGNPAALSVVRTDFVIWCRKLSSVALKSKMDSALCCVAYKSTVDVPKMDFDDFRSVYAQVLNFSGEMNTEQILKAIEDAKKIFKALGGKVEHVPSWGVKSLRSRPNPVLTYFSPVEAPTEEPYAKL